MHKLLAFFDISDFIKIKTIVWGKNENTNPMFYLFILSTACSGELPIKQKSQESFDDYCYKILLFLGG